jgi:hypothetical protein
MDEKWFILERDGGDFSIVHCNNNDPLYGRGSWNLYGEGFPTAEEAETWLEQVSPKLTLKELAAIREALTTGELCITIITDPASLFGDQEPPSNECVIRYHALLKAAILREYPNADISMGVGPTMRPVICCDPDVVEEIIRIREKVYLAGLFY